MNRGKVLIALGVLLFIIPFASGIVHCMIESWRLIDWLVLYSYVYWPTYVMGILMILYGRYKLKRK